MVQEQHCTKGSHPQPCLSVVVQVPDTDDQVVEPREDSEPSKVVVELFSHVEVPYMKHRRADPCYRRDDRHGVDVEIQRLDAAFLCRSRRRVLPPCPLRVDPVWNEVKHGEHNARELLRRQESLEGPLAVELLHWFTVCQKRMCSDLLTLVVAIGRAVPGQETQQ